MTFNLVHEPWVPVLRLDGSSATLSLADCFAQAHNIRRLVGELPTVSFALVRLLLAITHDAIGFHDKDALRRVVEAGIDVGRIVDYLSVHADRFDLFDARRPFFQVAGLRTAKDEASGLEKLIGDVPNGEPYLTTRGGRSLERIPAAEAARWLVHCQAFDPSGIRSGAVGDPLVTGGKGYPIGPAWSGHLGGIVIHGQNVAETIAYNLTHTARDPRDRPVWALDSPHTEQRSVDPEPAGPVALLVWQSRRVRLVGDRSGVTGVVLCQGDKMTPQNRHGVEPMTAWRFSEPQSKKFGHDVYMPLKHDPTRAGWRGFPSLVAPGPRDAKGREVTKRPLVIDALAEKSDDLDLEMVVGLELVGVTYGPQESTVADIVHDRLDFRVGLIGGQAIDVRTMIHDNVHVAGVCVREVGKLAANVARAAGDRDGSDGALASAQMAAWAALDRPARSWLETLSPTTDTIEAKQRWQLMVRRELEGVAASIVAGASPAAVAGRRTAYGFMTVAQAELILRKALRTELPLAHTPPRKEMTA